MCVCVSVSVWVFVLSAFKGAGLKELRFFGPRGLAVILGFFRVGVEQKLQVSRSETLTPKLEIPSRP